MCLLDDVATDTEDACLDPPNIIGFELWLLLPECVELSFINTDDIGLLVFSCFTERGVVLISRGASEVTFVLRPTEVAVDTKSLGVVVFGTEDTITFWTGLGLVVRCRFLLFISSSSCSLVLADLKEIFLQIIKLHERWGIKFLVDKTEISNVHRLVKKINLGKWDYF